MKKTIIIILFILLTSNGWTDIAPNPIVLKSLMTYKPCEIQMVSERVEVDLYPDSSFVSCSFNMINHGDRIMLPVGFPVMNFWHWNINQYDQSDKERFMIFVDNKKLDKNDIQVPEEMKGTYHKYMAAQWAEDERKRRQDSVDNKFGVIEKRNLTKVTKGSYAQYRKASNEVYEWRRTKPHFDSDLYKEFDSLMEQGNYPWYIWRVKFEKGQSKTIKVNYMVPSGMGYGAEYRFIKYLISTGTGWKDKISRADITVRLHKIKVNTLETISPPNYKIDNSKKVIRWTFFDIEPTTDNDIYIKYYNPRERRRYENFRDKRAKQLNN